MKEAFRALLTDDATVSALVADLSINWREHPQGRPYPALVLHLINSSPTYTLSDVTDIWGVRVQVNCLTNSRPQAEAVSEAVIDCLSGYQSGPFYQIRLAGKRDVEPSGAATPTPSVAVMLDFTFDYRRS